jgi:hypothetical protein
VDSSSLISQQGTDGISYPVYKGFNYGTMEVLSNGGLIFPGGVDNSDTSIIVLLNDSQIAHIMLTPGTIYKNPVIKAIVSSVNAE